MYGPQDPLVVQKRSGEGGGAPDLVGKLPRIPNGEVVYARSLAWMAWWSEGGGNNPVPSPRREGLDVGIIVVEPIQPLWKSLPRMRR
jgi:hypothetical protein